MRHIVFFLAVCNMNNSEPVYIFFLLRKMISLNTLRLQIKYYLLRDIFLRGNTQRDWRNQPKKESLDVENIIKDAIQRYFVFNLCKNENENHWYIFLLKE